MINRWLITTSLYLFAGNSQTTSAIVTVIADKSIVYAGVPTMVPIWVEVKEGYHIQANIINDEFLIPTTLEVNDNAILSGSSLEFPPDKKFNLEGADTFLLVYDGKFQIKLFLSVAANTLTGKYVLAAVLRYQACDFRSCLFPRIINFSIPVEVKPAK